MSDSLQVQIETAIVSSIRDLALVGLASENVQRQLVPLDRDLVLTALPAVRVGPQGREAYDGGTNTADDIAYPVQVLIVARTNQDLSAGSFGDAWLLWREQIARAFHHQRLPSVSDVYDCRVEPQEIVVPSAWLQQNLFVSGLLVWCTARRLRM